MKKFHIITAILLAALMLLVAGCGTVTDTDKVKDGDKQTNVIEGVTSNPISIDKNVKDYTLVVDGRTQTFTKSEVKDGACFAPIIEYCEAMNIGLTVDGKAVTMEKAQWVLTFNVGDKSGTLTLNSVQKNVTFDAASYEADGTIMASIKGITDVFGFKSDWNSNTETLAIGTREKSEWWFAIMPMSEIEKVDSTDSRIGRSNAGAEFSWGALLQNLSWNEQLNNHNRIKMENKRSVSYYEASGEAMVVIIGYKTEPPETGYDTLFQASAWSISPENASSMQHYTYSGLHNEMNDEKTVTGLGYTREALGYSEPKFPDDSSALGYYDDPELPFPLNAKIYWATMAHNITGNVDANLGGEWTAAEVPGMIQVTVGTKMLPKYIGKSEGDVVGFKDIGMHKDPASPFWYEHIKLTAIFWAERGIDGAWCDNMSPWDNFGGLHNMFGLWSEYKFNLYLKEKYSAEQLKAYGIDNMDKFNIRDYITSKAEDLGSTDPLNKDDRVYSDFSWLDDPVWVNYKLFKSESGSEYLKNMYKIIKEEYEIRGITDGFCVQGNDMPSLNHGWITDEWMDMNSSEINMGWNLTFGTKGIGYLPVGKLSIFYRASLETQQAPYSTPWVYADATVGRKLETGKIFLAEAFANGALIKTAENTVGTDASHRWFNKYLYKYEEEFGIRYPKYDIAILHSTDEQLANMAPNALTGPDMNYQFHMQGMWGFSAAMADNNIPYRVLPMYKLNAQALKGLKTLIIPNVESMTDETAQIIIDYANNGGRVVISGQAGTRYSRDQLFTVRDKELFKDATGLETGTAVGINRILGGNGDYDITTVAVGQGEFVWMPAQIGHEYFTDVDYRADLTSDILKLIGTEKTLLDAELPITMAAYLWTSRDGADTFIDIVNYDGNLEDDTITPTAPCEFKVKLSDGINVNNAKVIAMTPGGDEALTEVSMTIENGWATVKVGSFEIFTSIKISDHMVG